MPMNVLVAQSGGPSPVINNTLRGIAETCRAFPDTFGRVYAGRHGIEGVLREELLDLSAQDEQELALLRVTPAAGAIGTCRYRLSETQAEDSDRIIEVIKAHGIGHLFYIGGNDSMETAGRVSRLASEHGLELVATGVPKTIDNDLGDAEFKLIDHTPGYGSVARYMAQYVTNANEENRGSAVCDPVLVIQVMGRRVGFIPAAARLADPRREMPLQIYMPESGVGLEAIGTNVVSYLEEFGRCIVVVSEGLDVGEVEGPEDSFGHSCFGSARLAVAQVVAGYLNSLKLPVSGRARYQIPGTDQRSAAVYASTVDLEEAYKVGQKSVLVARRDGNGWMGTILREAGQIYKVRYDRAPLEVVASATREFPENWISRSGYDVTDDFIRYAQPLIGEDWPSVPLVGGVQRFARLEPIFVEKKLPDYEPQGYRAKC